jgi:hypothetical protein
VHRLLPLLPAAATPPRLPAPPPPRAPNPQEVAEVGDQVHRLLPLPLQRPLAHIGVAADIQPITAHMGRAQEQATPRSPGGGWERGEEQQEGQKLSCWVVLV